MTDLKMILKDGGFQFFLENIKGSKLKTALKSGIRKSLNIIKKKATQNLKAVKFKSGTLDVNKPVKFKNSYGTVYNAAPFSKGIVTKVKRDGSGGRVEIITRNGDKLWNPILKMMEAGKGIRRTKGKSHIGKVKRKSHSTGSISHTFFTTAVQASKSQVHDALQENLHKAIMRARDNFYK